MYLKVDYYEAALRHADFYLHKLKTLNVMYEQNPDEAVRQVRQWWSQLQHAFNWARQYSTHDLTLAQLCMDFVSEGILQVILITNRTEWMVWLDTGLTAARLLGNQQLEFDFLLQMGVAAHDQGDMEKAEAIMADCRQVAEILQDPSSLARAYFKSAIVDLKRYRHDEAHHHLQQAKHYYTLVNDYDGLGRTVGFEAALAIDAGKYDLAQALLLENITYWHKLSNIRQVAIEHYQLGVMLANRLHYEAAVTHLTEARAIFQRLGERRREAYCLEVLGGTYPELGQVDKGLECVQLAYDLFHQVGDQRGMASALVGIGEVHLHRKKYETALGCFLKSLEASRAINYAFGIAKSLRDMGYIYIEQQDWALARASLVEGYAVAKASNVTLLVLLLIATLPPLMIQDGYIEEAAQYCAYIRQQTQEPLIMRFLEAPTLDLEQRLSPEQLALAEQAALSLTPDHISQHLQTWYTS